MEEPVTYRYPWRLSKDSGNNILRQLALNVEMIPRNRSTILLPGGLLTNLQADLKISEPGLKMAIDAASRTGEIEPLHTVGHFLPEDRLQHVPEPLLEQIGRARVLEAMLVEEIKKHVHFTYLETSDNFGVRPDHGKLLMRSSGKYIAFQFSREDKSVVFTKLPAQNISTIEEAKEVYRTPLLLESSVQASVVFSRNESAKSYGVSTTILPLFAYSVLGTLPQYKEMVIEEEPSTSTSKMKTEN